MRWHVALAGLVLLALPGAGFAQAELAIIGHVAHPRTLSMVELRGQPAVTVHVAQRAGQHPQEASFTGALLWPLLAAADPVDEAGKGAHLQHVIIARGSDSYAVALAIGELDPEFEGKQVLIAYERDGTALATPQLVVPGTAGLGAACTTSWRSRFARLGCPHCLYGF